MALQLKDLIGPGIAFLAVTAGILQYRSTSNSEFIRPVREAQLRLYQEASSAAAQIATLPRDSTKWTESREQFLKLYYGPMAIVEDFQRARSQSGDTLTVEDAMIAFKSCMDDEKQCGELGANLVDLSLALAHACRESLGRSWGYDLSQLQGDYQNHALQYMKKLEEKEKDDERRAQPNFK